MQNNDYIFVVKGCWPKSVPFFPRKCIFRSCVHEVWSQDLRKSI